MTAPDSPAGARRAVPDIGIRLTIGEATAAARLYDTATARDFASLLPLTIMLSDLGSREKAGALPRALTAGAGQRDYRAGQVGYWSPSHDLAIYYYEDGFRIPSPGIVMIGEIESGLDAISRGGAHETVRITVEPHTNEGSGA